MQHSCNVVLTEGVLAFYRSSLLNLTEKGRDSSLAASSASVTPEWEATDNRAPASSQFMSLRVVRGPLEAWKSEIILRHYNRLVSANIPVDEYLHWVKDGPEGPAWHVLLANDASEIVGHSSVIPLRCRFGGRPVLAGKSEYSFILEEYRSAKIRGFESLGKPRNAIMVHQLFLRCQAEGLGPLLISTSSARQRSLGFVGCAAASFPVCECLLILRPWNSARMTPNLQHWQRVSLGLTGVLQRSAWSLAHMFQRASNEIHHVPVGEGIASEQNHALSFFEDSASAKWRYLEGKYEQLVIEGKKGEYLILKAGVQDRYLRVCQWRFGSEQPTLKLIAKLVELANKEGALGVRWAVYGTDAAARKLARRLGKFGFLCARRTRTLLIFSKEQKFHSIDVWNLTDALFSFDP